MNIIIYYYQKLLCQFYLYTEKILIYQEDTMIFKDNINDFIEYDYIGAPWPSHKNDNSYNVGNGNIFFKDKKKNDRMFKFN